MSRGAKPGNRNNAGKRQRYFTESELKHLLILPAIKQLSIFCQFHRDSRTIEELMAESGLDWWQVVGILFRGRKAIGLHKIRRSYRDDWVRPAWAREMEIHIIPHPGDADPYPWTPAIEQAARAYFCAFALKRFEVARRYFVLKMTRKDIAGQLSIPVASVQSVCNAVARLASGKQIPFVRHTTTIRRAANGSTCSGPEQLHPSNTLAASTIGQHSSRALDRAGQDGS